LAIITTVDLVLGKLLNKLYFNRIYSREWFSYILHNWAGIGPKLVSKMVHKPLAALTNSKSFKTTDQHQINIMAQSLFSSGILKSIPQFQKH
jgi:hypothetical protein